MRNAIIATAGFAALAAAAPVMPRADIDVTILNYALTLEYLEDAFYKQGLANYTEQDFCEAGAEEGFYANLQEISKDEATHVAFLSGALGSAATSACTYAFGATTAAEFLAVANVLEGVGVSAYLGAAQYITNKAYLTAAGSILTVEARHSAYLRNNQNPRQSPFPAAFDIPLDFDEVYSLAVQFITSCPSTNPALPVVAFPAIAVSPAGEAPIGSKLTFTVATSVDAAAAYFITSSGPVSATLTGSGTTYEVVVPSAAQAGQAYVVLTNGTAAPTDENIVAGPAVVQVADNDYEAPWASKKGKPYTSWGGKGDW